jgi:putative NADH-flavin reductase
MKITIFGATGGTGRHLVEQALAAGHEVTVVVRDPARLAVAAPAPDQASTVAADQASTVAADQASTVAADQASTVAADQAAATAGGAASARREGAASARREGAASARRASAASARTATAASADGVSGAAGSGGRQPGPAGAGLRVVTADVMDPAAISNAVTGADAVLTAIGPRVSGPSTVSADSAASIIAAMRRTGVRRLLTVSGSIVDDAGEGPVMSYLVKPLARRTFLKNVSADMRRGEEVVRASGLDWTIVRPPRLTDKPATGRYRTALDRNLPRGVTVSRADLAACMLALIEDADAVHRVVGIAD